MEFWNILVPALIFFPPLIYIVVFAVKGRKSADYESTPDLLLFGLLSAVSVFGILHFNDVVRLSFIIPLALEPSGHFEFSLNLFWTRYVWIFFSSVLFLAFSVLDGNIARAKENALLPILLVGSFLAASLAYLSENILISLMFIEIMAFLLHAFGVQNGGREGELERVSYFKRSSFIFLGLLSMLLLNTAQSMFMAKSAYVFNTDSLILLGVVLYIMSLIFSKHNFMDWKYLPLTLIQSATAFFLLSRVMRQDMAVDLWIPLSAIFALSALSFCILAFVNLKALNASFWLVFAFFGYLLFLRFSSGKSEDMYWGVYEMIGLLSVFALANLFRFSGNYPRSWMKAAFILAAMFELAVVSGAIPGISFTSTAMEGADSLVKLSVVGILTFLLTVVTMKTTILAGLNPIDEKEAKQKALMGFLPLFLIICIQIGAVVEVRRLQGEFTFYPAFYHGLTDTLVLVNAAALLLGTLAGVLIGTNNRFLNWINNREKRMEDLFPRIDPSVVMWNERLIKSPERFFEWAADKFEKYASVGAYATDGMDRRFFTERLNKTVFNFSHALSLLLRYFHTGSIRAYFFIGSVITVIGAAIFLLRGIWS